ncbi:MAG: YcgN family cysteine cluster protein [Pseudomonadota bacterium]
MTNHFWQTKALSDMDVQEWEALCDGCARCCMIKLEDEADGQIHYTAMVCHLLESESCRCTRYPQRHDLVPDCVVLTPSQAASFHWLPVTCAYRTLAEGRPLAWWHPLVSGSAETVHEAGISVRGKVVAETDVHEDDYEAMVIQWVEQ